MGLDSIRAQNKYLKLVGHLSEIVTFLPTVSDPPIENVQ